MQYINNLFTCSVLPTVEDNDTNAAAAPEEREVPQFTKGNFQYNWIGIYIITVPFLFVLLGIYLCVPFSIPIFVWCIFFAVATGMVGVTTGYHRLFSHNAFTAGQAMQWVCAFIGAGAFQGSIKWWARNHRIHHKFTDTYKDPYDARRGFWFSHCGWFIMRMDYQLLGDADVSDLKDNLVIDFQRRYFAVIAAITGIILPLMMAGATTGEWRAAFFWVVWLKIFLVHQFSFFINSLAHMNVFGATQPYADTTTPRDSLICALVTFGEGYHNFHHQFPNDYRNGYKLWQFDMTKYYIAVLKFFGFCDQLHRVPNEVIERTAATQGIKTHEKLLQENIEEAQRLEVPAIQTFTMDDVKKEVEGGRKLIIIDGYVLDLGIPIPVDTGARELGEHLNWMDSHPGGRALLAAYIGKDATAAFNGGVYAHTVGARNYLPEMRVGRLKERRAPSRISPSGLATEVTLGR
ncbi:stearic acid desaturase [Leptomonas pyrrhocoris]|uniref:Stearic acid desaturase n=1 Tax=Leptomonas pyrrhocoris TaxID=157538 RepID=A0A0N0DTA3_LEPPY|nr:stearic acid desaturase [Leptomonas pyrrhocoris]XP_015655657.1 stearic acid desaturase [Leptomonas pyrrhocoris]KPA77217.1 stearic acid desaturase [Leptomonas pyrrhocoris]KPA77218.1 stearic acid desaturase [Leptomonas pyrrhocoris]|eukprot:XP_015655656.1 stearic acid desaturase [Leptomonas pyrrhocoris]